jgi:hypothetical protein
LFGQKIGGGYFTIIPFVLKSKKNIGACHSSKKVLFFVNEKIEIEELLYNLQIIPITNSSWKRFDIELRTASSTQEVAEVKEVIRKSIGDNIGGIYIILKKDTILYIGESEESIRVRIMRHIDKVYRRTNRRSMFFKEEQHQGLLTICFLPLRNELIGLRKSIEEMLIILLEPEYKKWELRNKIKELKAKVFIIV